MDTLPAQPKFPNPQLAAYVVQARKAQMTDAEINGELLKAGWPPMEVQTALRPAAAEVASAGEAAEREGAPSRHLLKLAGITLGALVVLSGIYLALAYWVFKTWPFEA